MDIGRGDDDTGPKLLEDGEDISVQAHPGELLREHRPKRADGAGHQNDKESTDAQWYVVVSVDTITGATCLMRLLAVAHAVSGN